jgi:hypothetical protein
MLNRLFTVGLLYTFWKKQKVGIIYTAIFITTLVLTGWVHDDFLVYAASSDASTGLSFFIKWIVYLLSITAYLTLMSRLIDKRMGIIEEKPNNEPAKNDPEDACFDNIKKKDKLVTKADSILNRD